jgi:cobalt-zinc-cadmium efflux system protein
MGHPHQGPIKMGRLRLAAAAVAAVLVAEVVAGLRAGSLALLGDAAHLGTDVATLGLAWYAATTARRRATPSRTFGFHRTGILVALFNGATLLAVAVALAVAAVARLRNPIAIQGTAVVAVGAGALVVNSVLALLLGRAGDELSVRSAALHVAGDALASLGVVAGGLLVLLAGWRGADAAVSLGIAGLIAVGAYAVLREALTILAEGTPRDLDAEEVRSAIMATAGVDDVHDLHIWSIDRRHRALTAHVMVPERPLGEVLATLHALELTLCERFGIEHATLQPECPPCLHEAQPYCDLDERHAGHVAHGR